jgi:diguanylate cyclase (GGDEF)-like protein
MGVCPVKPLEVYSMCVAIVGLGLLAVLCLRAPPPQAGTFAIFVAMAVLTEAAVIKLPNGVRTSVTFALVFPAVFIFGLPWAATLYAAGAFLGGWVLQKRPFSVAAFNAGQFSLAVLLGGYLHFASGGSALIPTVFPAIFFVTGFMASNHLLVSTYYSLLNPGRYGVRDWLESLMWDALNYALKVPLGFLVFIVHVDLGLAGTAAMSASVLAVANLLRLQTLLSAANNQLKAIQEVSLGVTSSLDLERVFEAASDGIVRVLGADECAIFLWDEGRQQLTLAYVERPDPDLFKGLKFRLGEGLVGSVAQNRKAEIVGDVLKDPRGGTVPGDKSRSLMLIPLIIGERLIGEIVAGKNEPGAFRKDSLRVMGILCTQVAVAIENASLYWQTRLLAITDGLTGLYNYRYFAARLSEEIKRCRRTGQPLSLVYLDLDGFKDLNDQYGHLAGDQILKEVAGLLKHRVRESDVAVRYAGDEFALLLVGTPVEEAAGVADRLKQDVEAHDFLASFPSGPVRIRVSIGAATHPEHAMDEVELVRAADRAMYATKTGIRLKANLPDTDK